MAQRTVTRLLGRWEAGDPSALDALAPLVYHELEKLASAYLRRERGDHTLAPAALVHEAFLRLVRQRRVAWQNRSHFFGLAAQMMRRVLVEHARARGYARRGRGAVHLPLEAVPGLAATDLPEVLAVDEALDQLAERYPEAAEVTEMRFFGGFEESEIAAALGISVATVKRRWRLARAWLQRYLEGGDGPSTPPP